MAKRWLHWDKSQQLIKIDTTRTCKNCGIVHPYLGGETHLIKVMHNTAVDCPLCGHKYETRTIQEVVIGLIEHIGHVEAERDLWKNLWYNGGYKDRSSPQDSPWDIKTIDGVPTIISGPELCPKCSTQQVKLHAGVLYPGNDLPWVEVCCPDCGLLYAHPYEPAEDPINSDAPQVKTWTLNREKE